MGFLSRRERHWRLTTTTATTTTTTTTTLLRQYRRQLDSTFTSINRWLSPLFGVWQRCDIPGLRSPPVMGYQMQKQSVVPIIESRTLTSEVHDDDCLTTASSSSPNRQLRQLRPVNLTCECWLIQQRNLVVAGLPTQVRCLRYDIPVEFRRVIVIITDRPWSNAQPHGVSTERSHHCRSTSLLDNLLLSLLKEVVGKGKRREGWRMPIPLQRNLVSWLVGHTAINHG